MCRSNFGRCRRVRTDVSTRRLRYRVHRSVALFEGPNLRNGPPTCCSGSFGQGTGVISNPSRRARCVAVMRTSCRPGPTSDAVVATRAPMATGPGGTSVSSSRTGPAARLAVHHDLQPGGRRDMYVVADPVAGSSCTGKAVVVPRGSPVMGEIEWFIDRSGRTHDGYPVVGPEAGERAGSGRLVRLAFAAKGEPCCG
jgi:hypothetical protein